MVRQFSTWVGVLGLAVFAAGCGDTEAPGCNADSCPSNQRCDTASGQCVDVNASPDGGSGCSPTCAAGQKCVEGACTCDPSTCLGCCAGNECVNGNVPQACGSAGQECSTCLGGQTCNGGVCSGCNETSCPTGCCSGDACNTPSLATCGKPGEACFACDTLKADSCAKGACSCGSGPACGDGQRCAGGQCVCDSVSCASGCCTGNVCNARTQGTCGIAGAACTTCDVSRSDACNPDGACACGSNAQCAEGQRCAGGTCVCDGTSCPDGCCGANGTCNARSTTTCGTAGGVCIGCSNLKADNCGADGACHCGGGPVCGIGLRCLGGACVCDASTCSGCCSGNACMTGNSVFACGFGGFTCDVCGPGELCLGGICDVK